MDKAMKYGTYLRKIVDTERIPDDEGYRDLTSTYFVGYVLLPKEAVDILGVELEDYDKLNAKLDLNYLTAYTNIENTTAIAAEDADEYQICIGFYSLSNYECVNEKGEPAHHYRLNRSIPVKKAKEETESDLAELISALHFKTNLILDHNIYL